MSQAPQGWGQPQPGWGAGGPPQGPSNEPSPMAWIALVCGVGSWVMLPFVAAIAGLIVGKMELGKIERGESAPAGKTIAQIGFYASIANIVVSVLALISTCCLFLVIPMFFAAGAAGAGGF